MGCVAPRGLLAGLPVEHGFVVTEHFVYALLLFGLEGFGAGRIVGLDARDEDRPIGVNNPRLRDVLG